MTSFSRHLRWLFLCSLAAGCASTYETTWSDPSVQTPLRLQHENVAVFAMGINQMMARAVENQLASEVSGLGAKGVPGFEVVPLNKRSDTERAVRALNDTGIKGAILLRVLAESERTRYVPGQSYYMSNRYDTFTGYWGIAGPMLYDPGHYEVDRLVYVEALYFSVPDDKLLWGGISRTTNPEYLGEVLEQLANDTAAEMRKAGLLGR